MEQEKSCNRPGQRGLRALCPQLLWNAQEVSSHCTLTVDDDIHHCTVTHERLLVITPWNFYDDRQSTHERTLRGGRTLLLSRFHSVCLTFVSRSFHPHLFTRPAYRCDRCALVPIMPARPRFAISGILAGGIPGFCIATFLLGTFRFIL